MSTPEELIAELGHLIDAQDFRQAAVVCDRLTREFPNFTDGWFAASRLAILLGNPELGLRTADKALGLSPERPEILFQRLRCQCLVGQFDEARQSAKILVNTEFKTAEIAAEFAALLVRLELHEAAVRHYTRAIDLAPDIGAYYVNLAVCQSIAGDSSAATSTLDLWLSKQPDDSGAMYLRTTLGRQSKDDNHVAELEAAIQRMGDRPLDGARLHYALARELEDLGDYENGFSALSQGAQLVRSQLKYSLDGELQTMRVVRDQFGSDAFTEMPAGHISADPIFIVGMPRTGCGLVDQILRRHPVVLSAGSRQSFFEALASECLQSSGARPESVSDLMALAATVDFERVGEAYVNAARPLTGKTAHFVDNQPTNFLYVGMIHRALPKARIVVLQRDPMDTCLQAYKTLFEGAFPFSYELEELAQFFNAYRELSDHWRSVIPDAIHTVEYEKLVSDPKPVIENLLQFCGLSFDEECLAFRADERDVESVGLWKRYESQLAPVRAILDS